MLKEVLEYLDPKQGENFIDCTLGGAGYTIAIANKVGENGSVLGIDLDEMAIKNAIRQMAEKKSKLNNIILVKNSFRNLLKIKQSALGGKNIKIHGIVFDLGLSSAQLDDRSRGFSFKEDAPLNMAFGDIENGITTEEIVNNYSKEDLEKIIKEYGEERFAKKITGAIINARKSAPIKTAKQLAEIIKSAVPKRFQGKIHPATKTFQALRIAANDELESLKEALSQALDIIEKNGRIVVVSYHSLEDRIVKHFFRQESRGCICPPSFPACRCRHKARLKILTPRVIRPAKEEVADNPRARSAKLRAIQKI